MDHVRRDRFLQVRATKREIKLWQDAAEANDLKLSEYVRFLLRREAAEALSAAARRHRKPSEEVAA